MQKKKPKNERKPLFFHPHFFPSRVVYSDLFCFCFLSKPEGGSLSHSLSQKKKKERERHSPPTGSVSPNGVAGFFPPLRKASTFFVFFAQLSFSTSPRARAC
jgi:hypothetical protein